MVDEVRRVAESVRVLVHREVVDDPEAADDVKLRCEAVVLAGDAAHGRNELGLASEALADENGDRVRGVEVVPGVDEYGAAVYVPRDDRGLAVPHLEPGTEVVVLSLGHGCEDDGEECEDREFLHAVPFCGLNWLAEL